MTHEYSVEDDYRFYIIYAPPRHAFQHTAVSSLHTLFSQSHLIACMGVRARVCQMGKGCD